MAGTRQESRERITAEILSAARNQLADVGAAALSLRAIARELGMVSSAVYRYVASRDELLTRLIVEAYDSLGAIAERAAADHPAGGDLDRWIATARAIRSWAIEHPHQFLLLYGSPVPGYAAPDDTVVPGTRVTLALVAIVRDAANGGRLAPSIASSSPPGDGPDDGLGTDLDRLGAIVELPVPRSVVLAFLAAWTQLFGLVSFELTNQTRGIVDHHPDLFDATARLAAEQIGLR